MIFRFAQPWFALLALAALQPVHGRAADRVHAVGHVGGEPRHAVERAAAVPATVGRRLDRDRARVVDEVDGAAGQDGDATEERVALLDRVLEEAPREAFFGAPRHPYTQKLFAALPDVAGRGARLETIAGQVPPLVAMPVGCRFAERCPQAFARCRVESPGWSDCGAGHRVRCHWVAENRHPGESRNLTKGNAEPELAHEVRNWTPGPALPTVASAGVTARDEAPLLAVANLAVHFLIRRGFFQRTVGHVKAVDGVTFNLRRGCTMGLVGESGCGKSTTGRTILRLGGEKTGGQVLFNGKEVYDMTPAEMRELRTKMQIIFQDPFSSLSPRLPVGEIIGEAVREHNLVPKAEFNDYIDQVMDNCGLQPYHKTRYPHEFSGGQRQRICIARALALNPEFVVCDEPVSALDVSIQAQIINLLKELQDKYNLTYLFISHDLSVVEHISDTVGVMYLGNLVEYGATPDIFSHPLHPYTKALFSAIPIPDPTIRRERIVLQGSIPSPANPPKGCKFHTRCPYATERCKTEAPKQREAEPGHYVVCHLYEK